MPQNNQKSQKTTTIQTKNGEIKVPEMPEICQELNQKQRAFAESYITSMSVQKASKESGYSHTHGYNLIKDARIKVYLNYLRECIDRYAVISKGQLLEKIGQRILSNNIKDNDLASLSREARYLQGIGENVNFNTQINITLPDTYNQFFASNEADARALQEPESDWNDVKQSKKDDD